jgi:hypothetical protein
VLELELPRTLPHHILDVPVDILSQMHSFILTHTLVILTLDFLKNESCLALLGAIQEYNQRWLPCFLPWWALLLELPSLILPCAIVY